MHILCTICSDLVNQAENIYVTKCGHIFHHFCLAQWIARSKSCPQCRHKVTEEGMFRLFPTISNDMTGDDAATLQSRLDDTTLQLRQQKAMCKEKEEKLNSFIADLKRNEELLKSYEKKLVSRDSAISAVKEHMEYLKVQNKEAGKLKEENEMLKKNIQSLNGLQRVLNATSKDVENMLQGYTDLNTIATFTVALKRALCESELKKNESRDRLHAVNHELGLEKNMVKEMHILIKSLQERLTDAEHKYESLKKRKAEDCEEVCISPSPPPQKQRRRSVSLDHGARARDDNTDSMNTMTRRRESIDSPYLNLKQSSLALSTLQRRPINIPTGNMKPSEYAILKAAHNTINKTSDTHTSIFHKKQPLQPGPDKKQTAIKHGTTYDGLGGHSKQDTFPVPLVKPKSCVPKVTAKHKLKRPTPPVTKDLKKIWRI